MKYRIGTFKCVNPGDVISIRKWKISREDPIHLIGVYYDEYGDEWGGDCVSFEYIKNGKCILVPDATELYHKYMLCCYRYIPKRKLKQIKCIYKE